LADAPLEIASKTGFVLVDDILPKERTFEANVASPVFAIVKASFPLYFKVISDASIITVCINYLFYHKIVYDDTQLYFLSPNLFRLMVLKTR
jgi:hypothetical protein